MVIVALLRLFIAIMAIMTMIGVYHPAQELINGLIFFIFAMAYGRD